MKKLLLGSTALVLCISGLDSRAEAKVDMPALRITGEAKGVFHQYRNSHPAGEFGHGHLFSMEDTELDFIAEGRMNFLGAEKYDWKLAISGDTNAPTAPFENRLRLRGAWGVVYFGNVKGVESIMARGAYSVMGGTGGFDGNGMATILRPTGVVTGTDLVGATGYATKISYITPRIWGLQLGASFTPNSEHKGEGKNGAPHYRSSVKTPKEPFDVNSWAGGINYKQEFCNGLAISMSATGIVAYSHQPQRGGLNQSTFFNSSQTARVHNTQGWALGGVAEYRGFELGVEWMNNRNSRQYTDYLDLVSNPGQPPFFGIFNAGKAFSIASGYTFGPDKVAVGYYGSTRKFNGEPARADIYSVTYDRKLIPGLSIFAEFNRYFLHSSQAAVNFQNRLLATAPEATRSRMDPGRKGNNAHAILLGSKLKF